MPSTLSFSCFSNRLTERTVPPPKEPSTEVLYPSFVNQDWSTRTSWPCEPLLRVLSPNRASALGAATSISKAVAAHAMDARPLGTAVIGHLSFVSASGVS